MTAVRTHAAVVLEPASQAFVAAAAPPPLLYDLTPTEARAALDDVQAAPLDKLPVADGWTTVPAGVGDVRVRIVRPPEATGTLPAVLGRLRPGCRAPPGAVRLAAARERRAALRRAAGVRDRRRGRGQTAPDHLTITGGRP
jgi:hypothetical protein